MGYSGAMDTAIAIRTLVIKNNIAYLQAGAGIVYDSIPVDEEKETMKKMNALAVAIGKTELSLATNIIKQ